MASVLHFFFTRAFPEEVTITLLTVNLWRVAGLQLSCMHPAEGEEVLKQKGRLKEKALNDHIEKFSVSQLSWSPTPGVFICCRAGGGAVSISEHGVWNKQFDISSSSSQTKSHDQKWGHRSYKWGRELDRNEIVYSSIWGCEPIWGGTVLFPICPSPVLGSFFLKLRFPEPSDLLFMCRDQGAQDPFLCCGKKSMKRWEKCVLMTQKKSPRVEMLGWFWFCFIFNELMFVKMFSTHNRW